MTTPAYLKTRSTDGDRYRATKVHVDDWVKSGTRRYGTWRAPSIDMSEYDRYVVRAADINRIDMIAYHMYQDSRLWWAICLVNDIQDSFDDLYVGQILKIPKLSSITAAFADVTVE